MRPISMAGAGEPAPAMAPPSKGSSNRKASSSQEMSTSSGSRVRRLGTMAMSSNPYARLPDLPMPISSSATLFPFALATRSDRVYCPPPSPPTMRTRPSGPVEEHQLQELVEYAGRRSPHDVLVQLEEVDGPVGQ